LTALDDHDTVSFSNLDQFFTPHIVQAFNSTSHTIAESLQTNYQSNITAHDLWVQFDTLSDPSTLSAASMLSLNSPQLNMTSFLSNIVFPYMISPHLATIIPVFNDTLFAIILFLLTTFMLTKN